MFFGGILAMLGGALQAGATTIAMLIAGRVIAGLAVGLMSSTVPVYCVCFSMYISHLTGLTNPIPEQGVASAHPRVPRIHAAMDDRSGDRSVRKSSCPAKDKPI